MGGRKLGDCIGDDQGLFTLVLGIGHPVRNGVFRAIPIPEKQVPQQESQVCVGQWAGQKGSPRPCSILGVDKPTTAHSIAFPNGRMGLFPVIHLIHNDHHAPGLKLIQMSGG